MSASPSTPIPTPSTLDKILGDAEVAFSVLAAIGPIPAVGTIGVKILSIIAAGIHAHESITGKPLDVTTLKPIDPIP